MKKTINYTLILLAIICLMGKTTFAQSSGQWTEKSAAAWVKKGEWRNGFKFKLYPDLDNVEFAKQYHANKAAWDKAFAYMRDTKLADLAPGKYEIDGDNAYATVTDGPNKDFEKTAWESHRKYIDLQYIIVGKEKIGMMNATTAKVTEPYDEKKDVAHYDINSKANYYIADPETLYIFFPQNAHRPSIRVDGYDTVKKLVIKMKMVQ